MESSFHRSSRRLTSTAVSRDVRRDPGASPAENVSSMKLQGGQAPWYLFISAGRTVVAVVVNDFPVAIPKAIRKEHQSKAGWTEFTGGSVKASSNGASVVPPRLRVGSSFHRSFRRLTSTAAKRDVRRDPGASPGENVGSF